MSVQIKFHYLKQVIIQIFFYLRNKDEIVGF